MRQLIFMNHQRLRWACRRGMLELDVLLGPFFDNHFDELPPIQKLNFERLLSYPDPDLLSWFIGSTIPEDKELEELITLIKSTHAKAHHS